MSGVGYPTATAVVNWIIPDRPRYRCDRHGETQEPFTVLDGEKALVGHYCRHCIAQKVPTWFRSMEPA